MVIAVRRRRLEQGAIVLTLLLASTVRSSPAGASELSVSGLPLQDAIAVLEQQGLRVFYSSEYVEPTMRVTAEPVSEDPASILVEILTPHGLAARPGLKGTWLVVRPPVPPAVADTSGAGDTPAGSSPARAATAAATGPLEELIVSASRYEIRRADDVSRYSISNLELELLPDIGEDAIRAVARLPGASSNGLSSLARIRGGEIGETLVQLDGLRLYDPFHLRDFQGVFSVIDPNVVSSVDVYTGGFPANFGDRLSGVIDIETIAPPQAMQHELGMSFFTTSALSSGRFRDERGHWTVSARRSNLDLLYDRFSDQPDRPRYTDLFARLGFAVNDHIAVTGNILFAQDDIALSDDVDREERASASQQDSYAWVGLDHSLGGLTAGRTLIARTRIDSLRQGISDKQGISSGSLRDRRSFSIDSVRSEWSRLIGHRTLLEFGASLTRMRGRYEFGDEAFFDLLFDIDGAPTDTYRRRTVLAEPHGRQAEAYVSVRYDFNPRIAADVGLRFGRQSMDERSDEKLAPRISFRYVLSDRTTARASWGRYYQMQSINELQVADGVSTVFPPQRSDHFVVGLDQLVGTGLRLRVELYQKSMHDLRPRFENLLNTRVLLPELKPDRFRVAPSGARARGAEIAFDGRHEQLMWWAGLSWATVRDTIDGSDVPRSWDQTYALSAGFSWESAKWELGLGLIYRSGWPTSEVRLDDAASPATVDVIARNSLRMGRFGNLDLRVGRRFQLEQSELTLALEVANITDRKNPCCIEYEIGDEEDDGEFVLDEISYLPRIPSLGVTWRF
jgi:outer membrane receptor protein involved in Fe transport